MRQKSNWTVSLLEGALRCFPVQCTGVLGFGLESSVTQMQGHHSYTGWCCVKGRVVAWAASGEPRYEIFFFIHRPRGPAQLGFSFRQTNTPVLLGVVIEDEGQRCCFRWPCSGQKNLVRVKGLTWNSDGVTEKGLDVQKQKKT